MEPTPPSSSGLGYLVLSQRTGVRLPLGVSEKARFCRAFFMRARNLRGLPGPSASRYVAWVFTPVADRVSPPRDARSAASSYAFRSMKPMLEYEPRPQTHRRATWPTDDVFGVLRVRPTRFPPGLRAPDEPFSLVIAQRPTRPIAAESEHAARATSGSAASCRNPLLCPKPRPHGRSAAPANE